MLKAGGAVTMEFPHLRQLMDQNQFDTIYHEHFSYLAFIVVEKVFARSRPAPLPRASSCRATVARSASSAAIRTIRARPATRASSCVTSRSRGPRLRSPPIRRSKRAVHENKRQTLEFLIRARRAGKRVVGYGAPGKGNTLLNYCGIRTDFLDSRSIAIRTSRASSRPARAFRSWTLPCSIRCALTTSSSCRGTSRRRSRAAWRTSASGGAGSWCRSRTCAFSIEPACLSAESERLGESGRRRDPPRRDGLAARFVSRCQTSSRPP